MDQFNKSHRKLRWNRNVSLSKRVAYFSVFKTSCVAAVQCALPVSTFPSVVAATSQQPPKPTESLPVAAQTSSAVVTTGKTVNPQCSGTTPYMYPLRTGPFDYWAYASQYSNRGNQTQYPYTYNGYYPTQIAGTSQHYNPYTYTQSYTQNQSRNSQLNWQRPYQGPLMTQEGISMAQGTGTIHRFQSSQPPPSSDIPTPAQTSTQEPPANHPPSTSSAQPTPEPTSESTNTEKQPSAAEPSTTTTTTTSNNSPPEQVSSVHKDLSVLSSLQPSQIAEILCNNPEIQGIVWAAVDKAMAQARDET